MRDVACLDSKSGRLVSCVGREGFGCDFEEQGYGMRDEVFARDMVVVMVVIMAMILIMPVDPPSLPSPKVFAGQNPEKRAIPSQKTTKHS